MVGSKHRYAFLLGSGTTICLAPPFNNQLVYRTRLPPTRCSTSFDAFVELTSVLTSLTSQHGQQFGKVGRDHFLFTRWREGTNSELALVKSKPLLHLAACAYLFQSVSISNKTTTAPNAWAAVAWWRRFFEMKEKEEEERIEEISRILEEELPVRKVRPISAPEVIEARQTFTKDFYRNLPRQTAQCQQQSDQIVNRPNLHVPVGEEFVYLAQ